MIIAIRIKGIPSVSEDMEKTMHLLRLRRKYSCVLLQETKIIDGMLKKIAKHIAFGKIDKETAKELIIKRGMLPGDKPLEMDAKKLDDFIENLFAGKAKLQELKIKPFFRLHPPRGGFKKSTRKMWPKGMLGNQGDDINKLLMRML